MKQTTNEQKSWLRSTYLHHRQVIESEVNLFRAVARAEFLDGLVDGIFAAISIHEGLDGIADLLRGRLNMREGLKLRR